VAARDDNQPEKPTVSAKAGYLRIAPRKARLVADQVRGLPVPEARTLLQFSTRGAAREIGKLLDSAAANAENNHELVAEEMRIAELRVDDGPILKRWRARARGRATRIDRRTCHVTMALTPTDE
jgi:large subunit ribosomal protein L22